MKGRSLLVRGGAVGALLVPFAAFATTGAPEDIVTGISTYYTGTLEAIQISAVVAIFVVFLSIRLAKKAGRSAT